MRKHYSCLPGGRQLQKSRDPIVRRQAVGAPRKMDVLHAQRAYGVGFCVRTGPIESEADNGVDTDRTQGGEASVARLTTTVKVRIDAPCVWNSRNGYSFGFVGIRVRKRI